ncbi:MAG: FG-GAP-like repeat-containing protein [bacterium]|nr:FG-GAP-like repeat-containing protein [bacterium]
MKNLRLALALLLPLCLCSIASAQAPGTITTVAGGGTQEAENIPATDLALNQPRGVAVDTAGNTYIADAFNNRIRRVDAQTGLITTVAGTGSAGFSGDGGPATEAQLSTPQSVAVDANGNLYIADSGNRRIRRVDAATGTITTIAGTGILGFSGDGGPATDAQFGEIVALILDSQNRLYVSDGLDGQGRGNNRVRRIDSATGIVTTIAGSGDFSFGGDGGPATEAGMTVEGIALDSEGNLYISDFNNLRIRRVDAQTGIVTTVAGIGPDIFGEGGYEGDGGPATEARLNAPTGVAIDANGNLYIADTVNHRIRAVNSQTGIIVTVAGTGAAAIGGDGGRALEARLNQPSRMAIDPNGDLLITDIGNNRIRKLFDPTFRTSVANLLSAQLDFQAVSLGDPSTQYLRIANTGNQSLTIQGAISDNPSFIISTSFPLSIGPFALDSLAVTFNPQAEGIVDGVLVLTTTDPAQPQIVVPLRGVGSAPDIGVTPQSLTYERTFVGQQRGQIIQISNLGAGTLVIPQVVLSDTIQFSTSFTDTLRIRSGQFQTLTVTFRPAQPDTQRATLTLISNDPDGGFVIPLKGFSQIPKVGGFADASDSLGTGDTGAGFGASWADYDNDGDPDLYVVRRFQPNLFYRNDTGVFTEMAAQLGIADEGDGSGAAWADFDGDGDLDLYVTNFGQPNCFFRNDGNRFTDVAAAVGVDDPGDGYGAAWADYDKDGDPDLYVANFGANRFYQNNGGTFTEVAEATGLTDNNSSIQPAWADYDNDGDPDLFLANSGPNRLFRNDDGIFTDVTSAAGMQVGNLGEPSFGTAWGDFDNDGDLDLYVPSFGAGNRLYQNNNGSFQDVSTARGVAGPNNGRSRGAVWVDIDNDGDLDLYLTYSGQPNQLFRNEGGTQPFVEVADSLGVAVDADSRGLAVADFDSDGGVDFYIAVQNGPDRLFRNQEANGNWLLVRPRGSGGANSSPDAISARIEIAYGDGQKAIRELTGGSSFLSQDALTANFGLGNTPVVDTLTIRWPLGIVQRLLNIPVNTILDILETPPLPAERIELEAATTALVANGQSRTEIIATLLDRNGEIVLVGDLPITFALESGTGTFVGGDTTRARDGIARINFQAGNTPGVAGIIARSGNLTPGRISVTLLPPLEPGQATIRTVAGFAAGFADAGFSGDGGLATQAQLNTPRGVAIDTLGNLYISDTGNQRLRRVTPDGIIQTFAGDGIGGTIGDNGPAENARVGAPQGLAFLPNRNLLAVDQGSQRVRRIDLQTDTIYAFAGRAEAVNGFGGDNGPAERANFSVPTGVTTDKLGNTWIADQLNHRIRKVDTEGIITTFAGSNQSGFGGDGGSATSARLNQPYGVAVDTLGRVFIADTQNHRIRMVNLNGIITTVVGTGEAGFGGDGGPAVIAQLNGPRDVAVDTLGHLYIADTQNHRIRVLDLNTGVIQTAAGTGFSNFNPTESSALETNLASPASLFVGPTGLVYIADTENHLIRELSISFPTLPGSGQPGNQQPGEIELADFNGDGAINFSDFVRFASAYGSTDSLYDLSKNGQVGFEDFLLFAAAYERSLTTRPSTLGLLHP